MDELPEAYGIRKLHAEDLHGATDKLYKFLSGWMGGPHNQRLSERCLLA
jgi:hemoglobin